MDNRLRRIHFDLDVLRCFVLGVELGSFAKAADRIGRSTSAVSAQLKKLEDQIGVPVLRKAGRGMALTTAGETLLGYARRLLELNDEAANAVRGVELAGEVRIGLQEDFGEHLLTDILGRFVRSHPKLHIQARVARNTELLDLVRSGRVDLALAWDSGVATPYCRSLGKMQMCWIGSGQDPIAASLTDSPVSLAVFESPCLMRTAAIAALENAGMAWQVTFTSLSLSGIWAAVSAGLGVTVRTRAGKPPHLRELQGLPPLPEVGVMLHWTEKDPGPVVQRLSAIISRRMEELGVGARDGAEVAIA